ncbi:N-acetyltransferase [Streptomyces longisporoflavus]|uniref:GNAT family N-acetyltransferase n=1 Tax=Streptomyces longisporoflavus TaxID=28044 RepID=UPI00167D320B|nr:GNAT family N-acetyltransferase [Streptomyces longisporoflavus]GGV33501.1 N-acetyltransferase [Streptomyces longisporoflavus]
MPELQRLRPDHAPALLAFERENREYFAKSVPDRGDAYFAEFDARHAALLAEQGAGLCHFHVLVDGDGAVVGRVNLVDVADGEAELGYRIAEGATGRGLATAAVRQLCGVAAAEYGLTALRAATYADNAGSRAVLERAGFTLTGVEPLLPEGRSEAHYFRELRSFRPGGADGR